VDENTKRRILKDEEPEFKGHIPEIEQRLDRFKKLCGDHNEQIEIRYTPVIYTTSRQSICYNDTGPYMACDFRKLLSLDQGAPPSYMGTIYLQRELIDHIKENFEVIWTNGISWNEICDVM